MGPLAQLPTCWGGVHGPVGVIGGTREELLEGNHGEHEPSHELKRVYMLNHWPDRSRK